MITSNMAEHIEDIRRFNRFYTKHIGVLTDRLLNSSFSLTEARVIYELSHHKTTTATDLSNDLGLDPGYLSRIMRKFKKLGLIDKQPSSIDKRKSILRLTDDGQIAFGELNSRSHRQIASMLTGLPKEDQQSLVRAMHSIEKLLVDQPVHKAPFILRPHQPGDMGWIIHRHGVLYSMEYHWDEHFEALVAGIVSEIIQHWSPKQERCWIAEMNEEIVGSVFLVKKSDTVAKLRLLLVEPKARGLNIGTRLVNECVRFARQVGYNKITLWTNNVLTAARHIYEKIGFHLILEEPHHSFGHDLIGETWELKLQNETERIN